MTREMVRPPRGDGLWGQPVPPMVGRRRLGGAVDEIGELGAEGFGGVSLGGDLHSQGLDGGAEGGDFGGDGGHVLGEDFGVALALSA